MKYTFALISFVVGFCSAVFLVGSPSVSAPMRQQPEVPMSPLRDDPRRMVINNAVATNAHTAVVIRDAVPTVLPIESMPIFNRLAMSSVQEQPLDGLDCRSCEFKDALITYGGGAFRLDHATFSGTTRFALTGAAANTMAFLQMMQGVGKGVPSVAPKLNQPIKRKTVISRPLKIDFSAPFIGAK